MKTHFLIQSSAFLLSLLLSITTQAESTNTETALIFEDVWIAEAPPVSTVQAAYMTIKNAGNKEQKLVAAASDDFSSIEFHRTVDKNGIASMQRQQYLIVPAGGQLILKPGDYHMMLFKPARKLRAGDNSTFQFQLGDGTTVSAVAIVKKSAVEDPHEHHHH